MAWPLRIQHKGGWYHVVNRGIDRASIYRDDRDREHFVKLLEAVSGRYGLEVEGWQRRSRPLDEIPTHRIWALLSLEAWLRLTSRKI